MLTAVFVDNDKSFMFKNVKKININDGDTIIGYFDNDDVYHEESGYTPKMIMINKEG